MIRDWKKAARQAAQDAGLKPLRVAGTRQPGVVVVTTAESTKDDYTSLKFVVWTWSNKIGLTAPVRKETESGANRAANSKVLLYA